VKCVIYFINKRKYREIKSENVKNVGALFKLVSDRKNLDYENLGEQFSTFGGLVKCG